MDLCRYIRRATEVWSKQGKLSTPLLRAVCSHTTDTAHNKVGHLAYRDTSRKIIVQSCVTPPYIIQVQGLRVIVLSSCYEDLFFL